MENTEDSPMCNTKGKTMYKRNKGKHAIEDKDYITCLPEAIFFYIFSLLPLKEFVLVSLVSKQWESMLVRFLITEQPATLDLDEFGMSYRNICTNAEILQSLPIRSPYFDQLGQRYSISRGYKSFTQYVNRTLYLYTGCNIKKLCFNLCFDGFGNSKRNIDNWFHFALKNDVTELEINFSKGIRMGYNVLSRLYELPRVQHASMSLKRLSLSFLRLGISNLGAFGFLERLFLKDVTIFYFTIEDLMNRCPMLKILKFESCSIPFNFMVCEKPLMIQSLAMINCYTQNWTTCPIDISTPELLLLVLEESSLATQTSIKAPKLRAAEIKINKMHTDSSKRQALVKLFGNCSNHCKGLSLNSWCIQVLSYGVYFLQQSPILFNNVVILKLQVSFRKEELPGIAYLLRSCCYVKTLYLEIKPSGGIQWGGLGGEIPIVFDLDVDHYWQSQVSPFRCLQYSLKKVVIQGFCGKRQEIQMLEFILGNAKVLEHIFLYNLKEISSNAILQQLSTFQKASPQAIISIV